MRLLVLGGTVFLGHALVTDALSRGWVVTTFTRGRSGDPVRGAEAVYGDRTVAADLAGLAARQWDVIVDTCGFVPAVVAHSAEVLAGAAERYGFVSSMSVYRDGLATPAGEASPVYATPAGATEGGYGELKAGCERAVEQAFPGRALHIRAGLILGPRENIGRLPWWLRRIAAGGRVLAPGRPARPLQYVDVRDLAAWTLDALGAGLTGPVNVASRPGHATMGELLGACVEVTGSGAELVWTAEEVLREYGVAPWTELPCWVPEQDPAYAGFLAAAVDRAYRTGLRPRPVGGTVAATWEWLAAGGVPVPRPGLPPVGLPAEKEQAVLAFAG